MKLNLYSKIAIILTLFFIELTGLWSIDIGISAMLTSGQTIGMLGLIRDGNTQYHIGLGMTFIPFFIAILWLVNCIIKQRGNNDGRSSSF